MSGHRIFEMKSQSWYIDFIQVVILSFHLYISLYVSKRFLVLPDTILQKAKQVTFYKVEFGERYGRRVSSSLPLSYHFFFD